MNKSINTGIFFLGGTSGQVSNEISSHQTVPVLHLNSSDNSAVVAPVTGLIFSDA